MIYLLPINRVLVSIAVFYALIVTLVVSMLWKFCGQFSLLGSLKVALTGATILHIILLAIIYIYWERIWKKYPQLNNLLFPNLNGMWDMKINWTDSNNVSGEVYATATIKQSFIGISMEVMSDKSESETMIAQPKKDPESGRPILYYVYRVIPKQITPASSQSYKGAAILKFSNSEEDELKGNYFTSQKTNGYFSLTRK